MNLVELLPVFISQTSSMLLAGKSAMFLQKQEQLLYWSFSAKKNSVVVAGEGARKGILQKLIEMFYFFRGISVMVIAWFASTFVIDCLFPPVQ